MATRSYLPQNSVVTVRDSAGVCQEHTTRNEVDTTNASDARNPVSNVPCRMVTSQGYEVYYQESQEIYRDDETEQKVSQLRPHLFFYDIPAYRDIPNPSARLRRMAVRINLSCWVIPESDIPYNMISRLTSQGANCHVIPFDNQQAKQLVNTIITNLRKEIREAVERGEEALRNAERAFSTSDFVPEIKAKKYEAHTKLINKRLESLIADTQLIAERFGIDPNAIRLGGAMNSVNGVRNAIQVRCELIRGMVATAREHGPHSTGNALANAVEDSDGADQTTIGVLADYLEENDEDVTPYRAAFAEQPRE